MVISPIIPASDIYSTSLNYRLGANDPTLMYVSTIDPFHYSHTIKQTTKSGIDQTLGKPTYGSAM